MLLLDELREQIGRVDPDEFRSTLKRCAEVAAEITQTKSRGGSAAQYVPELKAELARLQGDVARMLALDCSLPRPGDGLQVAHLRARLAPVRERAAMLLDLAERSGGWVKVERLRRVAEQIGEIQRLEGLVRKFEGAR